MKKIFFLILVCCIVSSCKKSSDQSPQDETKYSTDFSVDDHTWFLFYPSSLIKPTPDGYLEMSLSQANYQYFELAPYSTINYNYSINADLKLYLDNSSGYGSIGLIFNFIDNTHYSACYITNDATYYAFKNDGGTFTTLLNTGSSNVIKTQAGQANHMEVRQYDLTATLLINGTSLGSFSCTRASSFCRAGLGIGTASSPYYSSLTGDFDNVSIKKINH